MVSSVAVQSENRNRFMLPTGAVAGWVTTLAVAGYSAVTVRKIVKTELRPGEPTVKPSPFSRWEVNTLVSALLLSFIFVSSSPTALGSLSLTALPFLVSATLVGYVLGSR